ncbi:NepR family anti-sigma factor [Chelatococcus sp. GCM10030263]|uniref:NepR family anti-sigma factor n=1 Tax=Chelatococcus sp. GCM10030263 TaxID=3273387 RepID=UPI0036208302
MNRLDKIEGRDGAWRQPEVLMTQEERPRPKRMVPTDERPPTEQSQAGANQRPSQAGIDSNLEAEIGAQLRSMYDDVLNEATPERFLKLLEALDKKAGPG